MPTGGKIWLSTTFPAVFSTVPDKTMPKSVDVRPAQSQGLCHPSFAVLDAFSDRRCQPGPSIFHCLERFDQQVCRIAIAWKMLPVVADRLWVCLFIIKFNLPDRLKVYAGSRPAGILCLRTVSSMSCPASPTLSRCTNIQPTV